MSERGQPLSDLRLLLLDPRDNVFVLRKRVRAGETIAVEGSKVTVSTDMPMAHKLARRAIGAGEKVVKYGAPIGTATSAIAPGDHVHVHNLKSDWTPTITLDAARALANGSDSKG